MAEVVTAYKDKGSDAGVKQVQSTGLHIGGERFVVLKADDRSVYGKKVSSALHSRGSGRERGVGHRLTRWLFIVAGQRRRGDSENNPSHPRHALPGISATRRGGEYSRAAGRLPD